MSEITSSGTLNVRNNLIRYEIQLGFICGNVPLEKYTVSHEIDDTYNSKR
jgi:hypothetical protein